MIVKYDFSGFMPRQEKDKGELVVYLHKRATTGEPFYVGIGTVDRPIRISNRNGHWKRIYNKHGRTIELLVENGSEEFVKKMEIWCIALFRSLVGRKRMANISDGGEGRYGMTGELHGKFQGFLRLYDEVEKVQLIVEGAEDMKENGFNHGDVYAVKNGKRNGKRNGSVGSPFYADENGFRIQFKVAGPFATRDEASVDGYQLAEKNSSDAKANFSELNAGKNLGTTHWNFKGFTFGVNRNAKKIALAFGRKDIKEQGFHPGAVSRNILGNPENNHHKGFTFVRISDPEDVLIIAGQYLEEGYEFHHELTEKNFLSLCDTSS